ncbi:MAG: IS1634 family transposase [Candidatus Nealsonbacteria bacterium]|nr:MAG: IS1634 family transposase [Candidatus Nealsonbacteria bacterium]
MYIETVPNRDSPPAILLRESWREGKKTKKRTIANLTNWPDELITSFRKLLQGAVAVHPKDLFSVERSVPHGHVKAILGMMHQLKLDILIASKPCRERDLTLGMIAEQILHPTSKLGFTRIWNTTTLPEELDISDADEDDLYAAMDWLYQRQNRIEKKLAEKHLHDGAQVLYDVTSSYYEGHTCILAQYGHNRDGKKGKTIIVYGMMTDAQGRPVSVQVYEGSTGDPTTVPDQVDKLRHRFGLKRMVLVGDRGMLTQTQIDHLKEHPGIGWISCLRFDAIRELVNHGDLQLSLFDQQNLAEISSENYPNERLIACYNPLMAEQRKRKRKELLEATEEKLEKIVQEVNRRTRKIMDQATIGKKVGKVINQYKMGKHFDLQIRDGYFSYGRKEDSIKLEDELDGIYVVRTSEARGKLSAENVVRSYKNLSSVEQLFRTLKGLETLVRPIRHREERRVRAHIFICMLAYYVEWHMRKALAPLLFDDEQLTDDKKTRDPVAPAKPSVEAKLKKRNRKTADGLPIHSFKTLLDELGMYMRNYCSIKELNTESKLTVNQYTALSPIQKRTFELLNLCVQ